MRLFTFSNYSTKHSAVGEQGATLKRLKKDLTFMRGWCKN
jgi:hypothetical protein